MSQIKTFIYEWLSSGQVPEVVACEMFETHPEECNLTDLTCDFDMKA